MFESYIVWDGTQFCGLLRRNTLEDIMVNNKTIHLQIPRYIHGTKVTATTQISL